MQSLSGGEPPLSQGGARRTGAGIMGERSRDPHFAPQSVGLGHVRVPTNGRYLPVAADRWSAAAYTGNGNQRRLAPASAVPIAVAASTSLG